MIVDCDRCVVRGDACGQCVVTVLLGPPPGALELDGADRRALDTLAAAGMVPRLQLVECDEDHDVWSAAIDTSAGVDADADAERSVKSARRSQRHAS